MPLSPSSRRAWIEITQPAFGNLRLSSPSSRRAWIEIALRVVGDRCGRVALLAEGVDRNFSGCVVVGDVERRPPRGGRG